MMDYWEMILKLLISRKMGSGQPKLNGNVTYFVYHPFVVNIYDGKVALVFSYKRRRPDIYHEIPKEKISNMDRLEEVFFRHLCKSRRRKIRLEYVIALDANDNVEISAKAIWKLSI